MQEVSDKWKEGRKSLKKQGGEVEGGSDEQREDNERKSLKKHEEEVEGGSEKQREGDSTVERGERVFEKEGRKRRRL